MNRSPRKPCKSDWQEPVKAMSGPIDEPVSQEFSKTTHLSGQSRCSSRSSETASQRNRRAKALRRGWDYHDGLNTQTLISFRHAQQWRRRMIHFCFLRFAARTWKKPPPRGGMKDLLPATMPVQEHTFDARAVQTVLRHQNALTEEGFPSLAEGLPFSNTWPPASAFTWDSSACQTCV